ncbi:MAG: hypothetical protein ACI9MR_002264 [Myxococcota bacterium]|jgi:hypothetical protein
MVDGAKAHALGALEVAVGPPSVPVKSNPIAADAGEAAGVFWSFHPSELQVYRDTAVHFRIDALPKEHADASCRWDFGDGSAPVDGCATSHTFKGGRAAQTVALEIRHGDWRLQSTRILPLERLSVTTAGEPSETSPPEDGGLPSRPGAGPTDFRMVLLAETARGDQVNAAVETMLAVAKPALVLHVGGVVTTGAGDAGWDNARDTVGRPIRGAKVPLVWAMSPVDLAEGARVRRPEVTLVDAKTYPERYTFTFKGAFFMVISSSAETGLSEDDLSWMRARLDEAQVYPSRFVVSHLPLHPFSEVSGGAINHKFQVYELMLRARVTAFISAGHRVYYKGRYGALPVVSVGPLVGAGGRLSGHDFVQRPSFAVMDVKDGVPQRIFAVEGPSFEVVVDEDYLPEAVEVYTQ